MSMAKCQHVDLRRHRRHHTISLPHRINLNCLQEARRYPQCLMKILITITDVRIIQFCLTLLEDFVVADAAGRLKYLHKPSQPVSIN